MPAKTSTAKAPAHAKSSAHAMSQTKTSPVRQKTASATGQGGRPGQYQGMTAIEPTRVTVGARTDHRVISEEADAAKSKLLVEAMNKEGTK